MSLKVGNLIHRALGREFVFRSLSGTDQLRCSISLSERVLQLGSDAPTLLIELNDLTRLRREAPAGEASVERGGIVTDGADIVHARFHGARA